MILILLATGTSLAPVMSRIYILVGGLERFLCSHILGIIIPFDFHIFQRVETNHQAAIDFNGTSPVKSDIQKTMERSTMLLGKSTISITMLSMSQTVNVYQAG
jgi:hypothetical protein